MFSFKVLQNNRIQILSAMAEENNTTQEATEQTAPQDAQSLPTANNAEDFSSNFNC